MEIKFKKLNPEAIVPSHGSSRAGGWDLYAIEDATIEGGQTVLIGTGLAMEIPEGYFGGIYARSGLASKQGLRPANCVGIVDSDYRGEVKVALHNDNESVVEVSSTTEFYEEKKIQLNTEATKEIKAGDRIAQLIIQEFEPIEFVEAEELSDTSRGEGGFGSTGVAADESSKSE